MIFFVFPLGFTALAVGLTLFHDYLRTFHRDFWWSSTVGVWCMIFAALSMIGALISFLMTVAYISDEEKAARKPRAKARKDKQ